MRAFAEKVLYSMGRDRQWLANFASESVKSEAAAITITTKASRVDGGWQLNGVKSFGCATGIANRYLVAASLEGIEDASGLCTFLVDGGAPGTRGRIKWNALGMRGSATEGLVLDKVFVADDDALAIPGAFTKMCSQSRSGYVGNQVAASCIYLGGAYAAYQAALRNMRERKFEDTGRLLGTGPLSTAVDRRHVRGPQYGSALGPVAWFKSRPPNRPSCPRMRYCPFGALARGRWRSTASGSPKLRLSWPAPPAPCSAPPSPGPYGPGHGLGAGLSRRAGPSGDCAKCWWSALSKRRLTRYGNSTFGASQAAGRHLLP